MTLTSRALYQLKAQWVRRCLQGMTWLSVMLMGTFSVGLGVLLGWLPGWEALLLMLLLGLLMVLRLHNSGFGADTRAIQAYARPWVELKPMGAFGLGVIGLLLSRFWLWSVYLTPKGLWVHPMWFNATYYNDLVGGAWTVRQAVANAGLTQMASLASNVNSQATIKAWGLLLGLGSAVGPWGVSPTLQSPGPLVVLEALASLLHLISLGGWVISLMVLMLCYTWARWLGVALLLLGPGLVGLAWWLGGPIGLGLFHQPQWVAMMSMPVMAYGLLSVGFLSALPWALLLLIDAVHQDGALAKRHPGWVWCWWGTVTLLHAPAAVVVWGLIAIQKILKAGLKQDFVAHGLLAIGLCGLSIGFEAMLSQLTPSPVNFNQLLGLVAWDGWPAWGWMNWAGVCSFGVAVGGGLAVLLLLMGVRCVLPKASIPLRESKSLIALSVMAVGMMVLGAAWMASQPHQWELLPLMWPLLWVVMGWLCMGPWLDSQIRMLFRRCSPAWVAWGWVALLFWMGGMSASLWWAHGIVPPQSDRLVTDSVTLLTIQVQAQLSQPLRTPSFESLNYRQWMTQAVVPGRVVASPLLVAHGQHLPLETELLTQTVAAFHWTPYRSDGPSFQPVSDP